MTQTEEKHNMGWLSLQSGQHITGRGLIWRCAHDGCKARLRTDKDARHVISQKNSHDHDKDEESLITTS